MKYILCILYPLTFLSAGHLFCDNVDQKVAYEKRDLQKQFIKQQLQLELEKLERQKDEFAVEEKIFDQLSTFEKSNTSEYLLSESYLDQIIKSMPPLMQQIIKDFSEAKNEDDSYFKDAMIPTALLLVGPPGTGKTDAARAIAQKAGAPFVFVNCGSLANEYQHSLVSNLGRTIDAAEKLAAKNDFVFVILDEIQSLVDKRKNKNNHQDAAFGLGQIIDTYKDNKKIVFIATANYIKDLPDNIKSRFKENYVVQINESSENYKAYALRAHLQRLVDANVIDAKLIDQIKNKIRDFSYREIKGLSAKIIKAVRINGKNKKLTKEQILDAIAIMKSNDEQVSEGIWKRTKNFCEDNQAIIVCSSAVVGTAVTAAGVIYGMRKANEVADANKKAFKEAIAAGIVVGGTTVAATVAAASGATTATVTALAALKALGGGIAMVTAPLATIGTIAPIIIPVAAGYCIYLYVNRDHANRDRDDSNTAKN